MYTLKEYINRKLAMVCLMYILGCAAYIERGAVTAASIALAVYETGDMLERRTLPQGRWQRRVLPVIMLCAFFIGHFAIFCADSRLSGHAEDLKGEVLSGFGIVKNSEHSANPALGTVYTVKMLNATAEEKTRVFIMQNTDIFGDIPVPGDSVYFEGKVYRYKGAANPGEYSYRNYMKSQGIFWYISYGKMSKNSDVELGIFEKFEAAFYKFSYSVRSLVRSRIEKLFKECPELTEAMLLGDKSGLSSESGDAYRRAGIAHLLAVSGMHIGVAASAVAAIFGLFGRRRSRAAQAAGVAAVFLMLCLCNFTPSAVRAAIMFIMSAIAKAVYRKTDIITLVLLAAAAALIFNPFLIYSSGFILSHYAVGGVGIIYGKLFSFEDCHCAYGKAPKIKKRSTYTANAARGFILPVLYALVMLPVTAALFGEAALYGVIVNMAVAMLFQASFVLALAAAASGIIAVNPIAEALAKASEIILKAIDNAAHRAAELPMSTVTLPRAGLMACFLILFLCVGFVRTNILKGSHGRNRAFWQKSKVQICSTAIITVLAVCVGTICRYIAAPELSVTFLNVGYGDSAVLEFKNGETVIIDGGAAEKENPLVKYCMYKGIREIDTVVLTHSHSDHFAGLTEILNTLKVKRLIISGADIEGAYEKFISRLQKLPDNIICTCGGDRFEAGGHIFEVLWPKGENTTINNTSVLLRLRVCGKTLAFTGDIEKDAEIEVAREIGSVDVLKVAHHGSDTSTCSVFVQAAQPQTAVISVGKNSYGHPSAAVKSRLTDSGSTVYSTEESGAVIMCIDKSGVYRKMWNEK